MASDSYSQQLYQYALDSKQLPLPGELAQQYSEKLIDLIKTEIESEQNSISFQRYMELALYAPGLGYYTAGSTKLGKEGDFITAPELSLLFSQSLANAILPALEIESVIFEIGAGSGRMAADILAFLNQNESLPKEYWILELSADLRERQKNTIKESIPELSSRVKWLDRLPEKFSGVVLANELLDAMPVKLFQKVQAGLNEVNVAWQGDKFVYQLKPSDDARLLNRLAEIEIESGMELPLNYVSEVNFSAEDWIKSIAGCLQQGMIILFDYGFPRHEYYHLQREQGTLMCHYRHRAHPDPFIYPGLQDITAHVDFTAMADAGLTAGLNILGYTNQLSFLMGAGLMDIALKNEPVELQEQLVKTSQIKKLTLPHEMGELFKVIGFSKNCEYSLPAFSFRDMREYL